MFMERNAGAFLMNIKICDKGNMNFSSF